MKGGFGGRGGGRGGRGGFGGRGQLGFGGHGGVQEGVQAGRVGGDHKPQGENIKCE